MSKKRIYEIARELGVSSKKLIAKLEEMGMPGLKAANSVDDEEYALIVHLHEEEDTAAETPTPESEDEAAADQSATSDETPVKRAVPKKKAAPASGDVRPPIVSVLGHIDHGKTTLLDAIRESHLASKEAGGITQGIAAYQAELHGQKITFVDTPGHKAFTGMRARGAQVTDIAILVVAADDGVMAQTVEAIDHIKAAGIPIIVAINKIDKANADISKVINDLAQHGLMPEAWGGDTIAVEVSALEGQNIDELLEMILLVAEMGDLRADPKNTVEAVIIESHLVTGQGPVATVIIRDGTLRTKDWVVSGAVQGRVKALLDGNGKRVDEALPGDAVSVLGFCDLPEVGMQIEVVANQALARKLAQQHERDQRPQAAPRVRTLDDLFAQQEEGAKLKVILKAASTGGLEAARREIGALDVEGVEVEILVSGVGNISESDIVLASTVTEECLAVGFGVAADPKAVKLAEREGIPLLLYEIIYHLVDEIESALKRQLGPKFEEKALGTAEVRETFKAPSGVIAGCYVTDGRVERRGQVRVIRNGTELFSGEIASLRRFEDDVREVQAGRECGIRVRDFNDIQVGDRLALFVLEEVER
ncbi:translation initiation factor IF-2 [Candidatus Bipolaricaulota bacterium]